MQELLKYLNIELSESSRKDPFLFWRLVFIKTVLLMTLVPLVITIIDFFDKTNIQTRAVASGLIAINLFIFTIVQKPSEAKLASRYIALLIILPNFIAPFVLEAGAADPSFINQSGNILLSVILLGFNKSYLLGAAFFIYNLIGATGILDPYMIGRGYLSLDDGIVFVRNYSICLVLAGLYFIEKIYTDFVKKITKEKMDEQKLENQEVLNKVAAGFAHELNNPLAIIDGYVNFLRVTQKVGDGKEHGALKGIEDSASHYHMSGLKMLLSSLL
jgi:signal transduction histidine kinase